ncbi:hypothetical protein NMY22_g13947 [Coprinellus aureogranulatus]|nr:hypothetical protein NMY22_g13947 [Coprinellus aureogranulatus]
MPFSTDTTWPAGLIKVFDVCRTTQQFSPYDKRYYGPYSALLTYCFGADSFEFFVDPQVPLKGADPKDDVDSILTVFFTVNDAQRCPVLIAEVKDDSWFKTAEGRFKADQRIRRRFDGFAPGCPGPRFWGLSLVGTSLRVYQVHMPSGLIEPLYQARPSPGHCLPLNFLEGA